MSNQPSRHTQISKFYSDQEIQGRRPIGKTQSQYSENVNAYDTPANGQIVRKGYSSDYPSRMRDGKPGA